MSPCWYKTQHVADWSTDCFRMTFSARDSNFYMIRCYYVCWVLSDCRERSGWLYALNLRVPGRRQVQQHHALKILIVVTFTARKLSHGFSQAFWKGIKHTLVCFLPFSLNASRSLKINIELGASNDSVYLIPKTP